MKTVILCGGRGTRLGEHGESVPKALIQIGGKPIIWHILKIYSHYGINDFILCLGFLGDKIKDYLSKNKEENWRIEFADTGLDTNTGGRIKKIQHLLTEEENFCVTYGDGLADVKINELLKYHAKHNKIATLTAVHPFSNFGLIKLDEENSVIEFEEKPLLKEWINGGYFVFKQQIFDYLDEDCILERTPLESLSKQKELIAFQHTGFWKCMDTFKDNLEFNQLWDQQKAEWKVWES